MTDLTSRTTSATRVAVPDEDEERGTMAWPEILAVTALLLFVAAVAAGWFDLMLPWKGLAP